MSSIKGNNGVNPNPSMKLKEDSRSTKKDNTSLTGAGQKRNVETTKAESPRDRGPKEIIHSSFLPEVEITGREVSTKKTPKKKKVETKAKKTPQELKDEYYKVVYDFFEEVSKKTEAINENLGHLGKALKPQVSDNKEKKHIRDLIIKGTYEEIKRNISEIQNLWDKKVFPKLEKLNKEYKDLKQPEEIYQKLNELLIGSKASISDKKVATMEDFMGLMAQKHNELSEKLDANKVPLEQFKAMVNRKSEMRRKNLSYLIFLIILTTVAFPLGIIPLFLNLNRQNKSFKALDEQKEMFLKSFDEKYLNEMKKEAEELMKGLKALSLPKPSKIKQGDKKNLKKTEVSQQPPPKASDSISEVPISTIESEKNVK